MIEKGWKPVVERARLDPGFAKFHDDLAWNSYEPLEGATEKDVGWVRCMFRRVMTEFYVEFIDRNLFAIAYRWPPAILGHPWS